jgi:hypothetical protein
VRRAPRQFLIVRTDGRIDPRVASNGSIVNMSCFIPERLKRSVSIVDLLLIWSLAFALDGSVKGGEELTGF